MACEVCGKTQTRVIRADAARGVSRVRRRRYECLSCLSRFTTIEVQIGFTTKTGERAVRTTPEQTKKLAKRVRDAFADRRPT